MISRRETKFLSTMKMTNSEELATKFSGGPSLRYQGSTSSPLHTSTNWWTHRPRESSMGGTMAANLPDQTWRLTQKTDQPLKSLYMALCCGGCNTWPLDWPATTWSYACQQISLSRMVLESLTILQLWREKLSNPTFSVSVCTSVPISEQKMSPTLLPAVVARIDHQMVKWKIIF